MSKSILLVDDEKQILRSLERVFLETDYQVFTANTGSDALAILAESKIDLIISDMRMPNMDGHALLKQVKQLYPATMRIILSGYADENKIFASLLDGSSKLYLLKPWDNETLLQIVNHMFDIQTILEKTRLLPIVNKIEGLATLGKIYNRLKALIESEAGVKEIADLIESDPVIAARVLSLANSAFIGSRTGSVHQAIVYLGLEIIRDVVFTISVLETAPKESLNTTRLMLWKHAALTNKYLNMLYMKALNKKIPDSCASAGLLHDIGKVFLLSQYPQEYLNILTELTADKVSHLIEKEHSVLGISHQELGGYLLNWWELPYPIVEAALFHHTPAMAPIINKELVCAVHLADYLAWKAVHRQNPRHLDEYALQFLQIRDEAELSLLTREES
ncbi:metal-dependent hydrolase hdod [Lucifera butyrica]|uniref:Metal-dependent hydrolase hdod n=1 Tax=Lucifera butyrica TaxID=1351585 RepID=A0A498R838_9FIRM|nr:response regulator [Lucifera butyrica]VBB07077.1 metal-dependent hydrolase hdod [Lucifera butyrica]